MTRSRQWIHSSSAKLACLQQRAGRNRVVRLLGGRGVAALSLCAALSLGGLTDAVGGVHFLVQKNLDSVQLVREQGRGEKVVASVQDGFAANSLFKLSRILPDALVTRRVALFSEAWLPESSDQPVAKRDIFHEEMARINEAIRRDFFQSAMPYGDLIHEKSQKYDVDPALVAAVIEQESKFQRTARSQVGAQGLMQIMPRTGRWLGARNLYDAEQNVDAGVKYIKYLQQRFDGNVRKTIAAYNAGEGNVKRYGGIPPFRETQSYVRKVMHNYQRRTDQLKQFEHDARGGGTPLEADGSMALR